MYKQLVAEYMRRESELKQQVLELTMENAELKDIVLDLGGDYEKKDNKWGNESFQGNKK